MKHKITLCPETMEEFHRIGNLVQEYFNRTVSGPVGFGKYSSVYQDLDLGFVLLRGVILLECSVASPLEWAFSASPIRGEITIVFQTDPSRTISAKVDEAKGNLLNLAKQVTDDVK